MSKKIEQVKRSIEQGLHPTFDNVEEYTKFLDEQKKTSKRDSSTRSSNSDFPNSKQSKIEKKKGKNDSKGISNTSTLETPDVSLWR